MTYLKTAMDSAEKMDDLISQAAELFQKHLGKMGGEKGYEKKPNFASLLTAMRDNQEVPLILKSENFGLNIPNQTNHKKKVRDFQKSQSLFDIIFSLMVDGSDVSPLMQSDEKRLVIVGKIEGLGIAQDNESLLDHVARVVEQLRTTLGLAEAREKLSVREIYGDSSDLVKSLSEIPVGTLFTQTAVPPLANIPRHHPVKPGAISDFLLLYGPPGTGKSRMSKRDFAANIVGYNPKVHISYFKHHVKVIQFHSSYTYEDFIEGIFPVGSGDKVHYEIRDGVFMALSKIASASFVDILVENVAGKKHLNPSIARRYWIEPYQTLQFKTPENLKIIKLDNYYFTAEIEGDTVAVRDLQWGANNYVLIIDEFSRGNVAKIFGELMYAIADRDDDTSYAVPVYTQYSNRPITIPENLSIIGNMNSSDRSVEGIDMAFRRRFRHIEFLPDKDLLEKESDNESILAVAEKIGNLDKKSVDKIFDKAGLWEASKLMDALNLSLRSKFEDDPDKQIGHSYFFKAFQGTKDLHDSKEILKLIRQNFQEILSHEIFPTIQAMCFGNSKDVSQIFVDAASKFTPLRNFFIFRDNVVFPKPVKREFTTKAQLPNDLQKARLILQNAQSELENLRNLLAEVEESQPILEQFGKAIDEGVAILDLKMPNATKAS